MWRQKEMIGTLFFFSPAELFVRSFVTESTSHPAALGPDVRCALEAVPKLQHFGKGVVGEEGR